MGSPTDHPSSARQLWKLESPRCLILSSRAQILATQGQSLDGLAEVKVPVRPTGLRGRARAERGQDRARRGQDRARSAQCVLARGREREGRGKVCFKGRVVGS